MRTATSHHSPINPTTNTTPTLTLLSDGSLGASVTQECDGLSIDYKCDNDNEMGDGMDVADLDLIIIATSWVDCSKVF